MKLGAAQWRSDASIRQVRYKLHEVRNKLHAGWCAFQLQSHRREYHPASLGPQPRSSPSRSATAQKCSWIECIENHVFRETKHHYLPVVTALKAMHLTRIYVLYIRNDATTRNLIQLRTERKHKYNSQDSGWTSTSMKEPLSKKPGKKRCNGENHSNWME